MVTSRDLVLDQPDRHEHSVTRYQVAVIALLERLREPESWWAEAACRGQGCEPWFPESGRTQPLGAVLCPTCPVVEECRQAGKKAWDGVWGGRLVRRNRHALPSIATRGPRSPQAAPVR